MNDKRLIVLWVLLIVTMVLAPAMIIAQADCQLSSAEDMPGWYQVTCGDHVSKFDGRVSIHWTNSDGIYVVGIGSHNEQFWVYIQSYMGDRPKTSYVLRWENGNYVQFWQTVARVYIQDQ